VRILVTGGCGFLGSHICEHYIKKGWEVIAYDNLTKYEYMRTNYNVEKIRDYNYDLLQRMGVVVIIDDIRNKRALEKFAEKCDYIVHTAAQPAMTISLEDPQLDFEVNVQGTLNVLECAKKYEVPLVNCSTIHVYGNGINKDCKEGINRFYLYSVQYIHGATTSQSIDEDEETLTGTLSPLHASKRAAEIYVQTYIDTYNLRAANFRLTGMYGPRQFGGEDHGWVANFAIKTVLGLPIKVFGTDKQVRDILYIKDAVDAFDYWHRAGCPVGTYNIGGGIEKSISIKECLVLLSEITGNNQQITIEPPRFGDLYYFVCDISKFRNRTEWIPKVIPEKGLKKLVSWIRETLELFQISKGG